MITVYTYFEDLPGLFAGERELLELCRKSWEAQGWDFQVLTRVDAEKHPLFEEVKNNDYLVFGSADGATADWERCSYYRWLALDTVGSNGLLIDYDMINYTFKPLDVSQKGDTTIVRYQLGLGQHLKPTTPMINYHKPGQFSFDAGGTLRPPTPCIIGSLYLKKLIMLFAVYQGELPDDSLENMLRKQCTDQLLVHYYARGWVDLIDGPHLCYMYGAPGCGSAPIVHYTHWSVAQGHTANRADFIQLGERPV